MKYTQFCFTLFVVVILWVHNEYMRSTCHILQDRFTGPRGSGGGVALLYCYPSNKEVSLKDTEENYRYLTTPKHNKARTVCILLHVFCNVLYSRNGLNGQPELIFSRNINNYNWCRWMMNSVYIVCVPNISVENVCLWYYCCWYPLKCHYHMWFVNPYIIFY